MKGLPELRVRSAFSFLEGASLPEALMARAAELEIPAVALLDRDGLSGAVRFHKAGVKRGIRALLGAEVTEAGGRFRYPLLCASRKGYQNLCGLLTRIKLERRGGATLTDLEEYAEGLVLLAGDPLAAQGFDRAASDRLIHIFSKANVYADLKRTYLRGTEARNRALLDLGLPTIVTGGVNHAVAEERPLMDILTCIRQHTPIQAAGRLLAQNSERHLKSTADRLALFRDLPDAVARTRDLADRLEFTLEDLGYQFPLYPVPEGETMDSFLAKRTDEGARRRYQPYGEKPRRQVERELKLIEKLGLAGYFLIVWDIVEFCRRNGILVQGRGSAANSAVCYSLGITAVDPVGMELLFERFLSEERGEWPDIDLDLPSGDDRERAIQYVYARYGQLGAAMTANVITYRGRSARRDVGKALGMNEEALRDEKHPLAPQLARFTEAIQDLPRHLGQHSGGMVICQGQLDRIVPLQPATMPGRVIVQWDKEDCADMGIIKVDLLGLGMMAALRDTIVLIKQHYHEDVDLAHLPADDPLVYATLQRADTVGMFQVESRAQMSCLPRLRPEKFYDLVVQVAIIRPGPIVGNMLHPYLRRRQGLEKADCLHPKLESVLRRTLGVPLFQEQLLRMAMLVANFSGGEAEELRRALGFKRSQQRMAEIETKLRAGMAANGIEGPVQDTIVQSITAFALYGFPESHAASFALLSYASAYLKVHYLAAFTAALLNNQPMGFYNPLTLVKDAQRHGLRFEPVDVEASDWLCTLDERLHLRLGLNYVKGLRRTTAEALVAARPFRSIDDLKRRVPQISAEELNRLAEIGALNRVGDSKQRHRREALWQASLAVRPAGALFAGMTEEGPAPLAPMEAIDRLRADFRTSGLTIGAHPMRYFREALTAAGVWRAGELAGLGNGRTVEVAGLVICRQQPSTAKGFVFLSLEDETGIANIILTPQVYAEFRPVILREGYLRVAGRLQNQSGVVSVKGEAVYPVNLRAEAPLVASHDFC
jgi:error-prone DNA polymerase